MDFGNINYGMPVPDSGFGAVEKGLKQGAQAVEGADQAVMAYTHGVLKNQSLQASTLLGKQLHAANTFIKTTPYVPREQVQKAFSGKAWDALPEELKKDVLTPPVNPDDPGIPMWKLAPHLFNQVAQESTDAAAEIITAPGWQNEFRSHAEGEIQLFQGKMLEHQFESYKADSRLSEQNAFKEAVNAQRWDYANFIAGKMGFHSPAEREQFKGIVAMEREKSPLNDALLSQSPAEVSLALADMKAHPENYANIPRPEQRTYALQLQHHIRELATQDEAARKAAITQNGKLAWDQLLKAEQDGRPLNMGMAGRPGESLDPEGIKQRMEYIRRAQAGEHTVTNPAVQKALLDQWASKPEDFAKEDLTRYRLHLANTDYEYLIKGQKDLRIKGSEETRSSQIRAIQQAKTDVITSAFGLDPKDEKHLPRIHQLEFMVDEGVKAFRANNSGREPNYAEAVQIADASIGQKGGMFAKTGTQEMMKKPLPIAVGLIQKIHDEGRFPTPEAQADEIEKFDLAAPVITAAWARWAPNDHLTDAVQMDLYRQMTDPASRARLDAQLQAAGLKPSEAGRLQLLTTQLASPASRITAASTTQTEEFEREVEAMRAEQAAVTGAVEKAKAKADISGRYQPEIDNIVSRAAEIRAEVEDLDAKLTTMPEDSTVEHRVWKAKPAYQMLKAEREWRVKELGRQDKRLKKIQRIIAGESGSTVGSDLADTFLPGVFAGGG